MVPTPLPLRLPARARTLAIALLASAGTLGGIAASADARPVGRPASAPALDPAVELLIRAHLEAMGGLERLDAIRTLRMTGSFEIGGEDAAFIQERSRPDRVRFEFATPGEPPTVLASDGEVSWQLDSALAGDVDVLPAEQADRYGRQTAIDGPLVGAWRGGRPIERVGRERLGDREVHRLRVRWDNGEHADLFVDAASHLLLRMDDHWQIGGKVAVIELRFADYRPVAGVAVPFEIEQRTSQGSWRWVAATVDSNVAIADSRYRPPRTAG